MPFLDWVNKTQATSVAGEVPYHLLEFRSAHGDGNGENLLIQGDNLLALKAIYRDLLDDYTQQEASEYLASLGIVGNRYLDGQSRKNGEGSYNRC